MAGSGDPEVRAFARWWMYEAGLAEQFGTFVFLGAQALGVVFALILLARHLFG